MSAAEQAVEALSSIKSISKSDAQQLMQRYGGSIKRIVKCEDYSEFLRIKGMGRNKMEKLIACFRGKLKID
jgi:ERCC4-type nuclease